MAASATLMTNALSFALPRPLLLAVLALGLLSACCPPCEKPNRGEFYLSTPAVQRMAFSGLPTQTFVSTQGNLRNLRYFQPVRQMQEGSYDCEIERRCGLCCETFLSEYYYLQFADDNQQTVFEFLLSKDFSRHAPTEPSDSITEVLQVALNGDDISASIPNVVQAALTDTVELNGRQYTQVLKVSTRVPPFFDDPNVLEAFYFSFALGVVGFEYADGTVWRLQ